MMNLTMRSPGLLQKRPRLVPVHVFTPGKEPRTAFQPLIDRAGSYAEQPGKLYPKHKIGWIDSLPHSLPGGG